MAWTSRSMLEPATPSWERRTASIVVTALTTPAGARNVTVLTMVLSQIPSRATSGPGNVADRVEVGAQRLHTFGAEDSGDPILELRHEVLGNGDDRAPLLGG